MEDLTLSNIDILNLTSLPEVDNILCQEVMDGIPLDINGRRDYIQSQLSSITGCVFSEGLNEWVAFVPKSIHEIASHASKSITSTVMALNCVDLVQKAVVVQEGCIPHSKSERQRFHFKEMKILAAKLRNYGIAKITVGKQSLGKHLVYCITAIEIEKTPTESTLSNKPQSIDVL